MYDPKFEKGVRQKMEGLEFTPSQSVWANIQKAVAGQRRRRGGLFFWRFALPAVLLAGLTSVAYFAATRRPATIARPSVSPATTAGAESPKVSAAPAAVTAPPVAATATQSTATTTQRPATAPAAAAPSGTSVHEATQDRAVANDHSRTTLASHRAKGDRNTAIHPSGEADGSLNLVASAKDATTNTRTTTSATTTGTTDAGTTDANAAIAPYLYQPALADQRSSAAIKAAVPSAKKSIISLRRLDKAKRPWEAGFAAGGGVSRLNRLNISTTTQDQSLSANLYNIATTNAAPSKTYVSDIRPDASFTAGIYLQKPLSRRWSVNLGMNLHYYSTRITIGQQVNTYVPAAASLIAPNVSQAAQTSTAFIAGDRQVFTNHYYFLELPVNVQYQLNKSHLLPLFVEGGVSLSRLMGSDALFYNAHSGVYYKDPSVLEKTQFNVSSALMVGLPFHGIRIMAGPQVEYGLTPLVNNHSQGDQHFFYGGLRIVVIPGRK